MSRVQCLFKTPAISIVRYDHWPEIDHCGDAEEVCSAAAINFVESGSFELGIAEKSWVLSQGAQFVSRPGVVHHYRHFHGKPADVCLSARYAAAIGEGGLRLDGPIATSNRLEFLKLRLAGLLRAKDSFALESWACDLISAIQPAAEPAKLYRSRQLRWYGERVEAARTLLEREFAEPHTLSSLARQVGMSTFHFARVFRELVGTPPHRFLLCVRLGHAHELLCSGLSVTQTCYDCGFMNLSHFTRSFQRRFGYLPSAANKAVISKKVQVRRPGFGEGET